MRKLLVPLGIIVLVLATSPLLAATADKAPDKVTIDDCVGKKAAVEFPHKMHMDKLECKTCHHTQKDLTAKSTEEVKACGSCHVNPEKAETPKCSEMSAKSNPFHITCVNCHKEEVAKKADSKAPTKCDQCHPKAT
jgi:hypothetical protein